jgi:hypothetical protein
MDVIHAKQTQENVTLLCYVYVTYVEINEMLSYNDSVCYFGEEIGYIDIMEDCDGEYIPLPKGLTVT